ncbi:serine hydrolase-like protein [Anarhichas minor]|uniref:serine hydrolase-like protein n=1 Tax=Anarhichas minor TaxID=65739 RepID=UPI003F739643
MALSLGKISTEQQALPEKPNRGKSKHNSNKEVTLDRGRDVFRASGSCGEMRALLQTLHGATSTAMAEEVCSDLSVPVPWGHIRGRVWGPDHGRPVLCLHGWADNCGAFNTLIPLLPKECRYVALDLSGHGLSSHRPPGDFYSYPAYVADIRRVADALQLRKFSIISHSMGAEIAALFSALYPEMVDALVLLDSYAFLPTDSKELSKVMRKGMDEILQFENKTEDKKRVYTYEKAVERLSAANPTLTEQSVHILLERGLVQVEGGFAFSRDLRVNFKNIWRISSEQSLEMQSRVQASVLLVLAEKGINRICFHPTQRKFISTLLHGLQDQNYTVVTVPGDHHVHLNEPEVVAPIVSDFLRNKVLSQSNYGRHKL